MQVRPFLALIFVAFVAQAKTDDGLSKYDAKITAEDRSHWAFQPVKRPAVPEVKNVAWCRNPIDRFILAKLEAKGWTPAPSPVPLTLLRRVYFDLLGLPPTPKEQAAFLHDPSVESLDRVIDNLLARPQYGERWARHWLDLARFAESNGYERDAAKPNVWRYRDWVIQSFNSDKPYDRFLTEQIAGDELPDADGDSVIATGFHRLGPWDDEPSDPNQDRFDQLDDIVSTTSEVFMGLTLGCARCHDHKFEPLTALDYTRMVAVFAPLRRPRDGRVELDLPVGTPEQVFELNERDATISRLRKQISAFQSNQETVDSSDEDRAVVAWFEGEIRGQLEKTHDLRRGYFFREIPSSAPVTNILNRGQATSPGPIVTPGFPAVLVGAQPLFLRPTEKTAQRRLTLARWLAQPDHPLTGRVIVNRVWQFHFGEGLVRTPSDFGTAGDPPTHPELLDWLADWFVHEGHWSIKSLNRLILTSNTSRMAKLARLDYLQEDPENQLIWRLPYHRLEVEAIRDAILTASGQLNPAMYGPSMFPTIPKGALEGNSDPDKIWMASDEREASRRTIYAFVKRTIIVPMIEVLDFCDTTRSAAKRQLTNTAPQALALFNGEFVSKQAGYFADRLIREAGEDRTARIQLAYALSLSRSATHSEVATWLAFLEREGNGREAMVRMARVIFNLNEFVFTD